LSFLWPNLLWLLAAVPVLVAAYLYVLRRKKPAAVRYASLDLVREALGPGQRFRRHVPPALMLLAAIVAIVGVARPTAVVTLLAHHQTIVMAMDVSLSMRATDVEPNRIVAAQNAAKAFIEELPSNVKLAIVTFAGTAAVVQTPTHSKEDLTAAVDRFQLQRATATGSGLLVSLGVLFPDDGIDVETAVLGPQPTSRDAPRNTPIDQAKKAAPKQVSPVPPGSNSNAAIILLSDGRRTTGPDPLAAAKLAADRGIRVFTVGFGTLEGGLIGFEGWSAYVRLDEETLKAIASITHGEYYHAGTASDLKKVYQGLSDRIVTEKKETEVTALFAAAAALIAVLAAALSLAWFNRSL
jgi:Ca-activated chloride channel homolog